MRRLIKDAPISTIRKLYKSGLTMEQITHKVGWSLSSICKIFETYGIVARSTGYNTVPRKEGEYIGFDGRWWVRNYKLNGVYKLKGAKKSVHCAVVVMERHLGHFIPKGYHVHHKDEDITNDDIENLELLLNGKHQQHHYLKGPRRNYAHQKGEDCSSAKLTNSKVRQIRKLYKLGKSQQFIANKMGVYRTTIGNVLSGKNWSHI